METKALSPDEAYENKMHVIGRVTLPIGLLLTFLPPVILWLRFGILPPGKSLLQGVVGISSVMIPVSIVEILTFTPILGSAAMYMSYLTGNISNMKLPSAAIAMESVGAVPGTKEGDIASTLAISGSVFASELIIALGILLIAPLSARLQTPALKPAFEQVLPALFGAIGAYYIAKSWKLAAAPLAVALLFGLLPGVPTALSIPLCVLASVLAARFLYRKGLVRA